MRVGRLHTAKIRSVVTKVNRKTMKRVAFRVMEETGDKVQDPVEDGTWGLPEIVIGYFDNLIGKTAGYWSLF